jgi:hypothetical protein
MEVNFCDACRSARSVGIDALQRKPHAPLDGIVRKQKPCDRAERGKRAAVNHSTFYPFWFSMTITRYNDLETEAWLPPD